MRMNLRTPISRKPCGPVATIFVAAEFIDLVVEKLEG